MRYNRGEKPGSEVEQPGILTGDTIPLGSCETPWYDQLVFTVSHILPWFSRLDGHPKILQFIHPVGIEIGGEVVILF